MFPTSAVARDTHDEQEVASRSTLHWKRPYTTAGSDFAPVPEGTVRLL